VAKLREEVTHARVAAVLAEARAAWVEEIAHERAVLLAIAQEEADEAAQRFSILEGSGLRTGLRVRSKKNSQAWLPRRSLPIGDG
jgi:hypothetical protein